MEKIQLDQLDMLQAVENHFNDNPAPWTGNVPIAAAKTLLSQKIVGITTQYAIQLINTTGIAEDKEAIRGVLEDKLFVVSSAVSGYADTLANKDLYRRTYFARSSFTKMNGAELIGTTIDMINDANAEMPNLAPYGVLPATITSLTTTMNAFSAIKANPEEAIFRRKAATEKITELLPEAITLLGNRMDNLVVAIEATQEAFVDIYRNARLISSSPTTTNSLTTTCVDGTTNIPIKGVVLLVTPSNDRRTSPASGLNIFKNLPEGNTIIVATHPEYEAKMIDVILVNNQTKEVVIELVHI
jgi:hypothetical protein